MSTAKTVNILGIRGLPAAHGGFETFAGHLAPYLRDKGWQVNVYCQLDPDPQGNLQQDYEDDYEGIRRIFIGSRKGSLGTILFDWKCIRDARKRPGVNLVLGYNTAIFSALLRASGKRVVMNMDGVEWKRAKWSLPIKAWFYLNELLGSHLANVPIADHPEIANHLKRHGCFRAEVIPYGAEKISYAPTDPVESLNLAPGGYFVSIARIEPENSILEMVRAFSARARLTKLVVLGKFDPSNDYHNAVLAAASNDVRFVGAIYDQKVVASLRFHSLAYVHGHQVGGTNPSLVEALAAGNAVIAHSNQFNRWVAGPDQFYFSSQSSLDEIFSGLEADRSPINLAKSAAGARHQELFTLSSINQQYESVLERYLS